VNDPEAVLAQLEALGTAQNRKVYARHGVAEPMFGVSFAHLRKLGKKLHPDHDLARALWASGNHDARRAGASQTSINALRCPPSSRMCAPLT
jgi:3-methyladenine DNA glycosylase AlkD